MNVVKLCTDISVYIGNKWKIEKYEKGFNLIVDTVASESICFLCCLSNIVHILHTLNWTLSSVLPLLFPAHHSLSAADSRVNPSSARAGKCGLWWLSATSAHLLPSCRGAGHVAPSEDHRWELWSSMSEYDVCFNQSHPQLLNMCTRLETLTTQYQGLLVYHRLNRTMIFPDY